ncbi:MAG: zinc ABC transporter substrate-binding protein [Thermodesulfobacteriota bacterium]|nr:zinc ABC transporter substrate-binding protein [Thermodesulfobacteriota bacterium]
MPDNKHIILYRIAAILIIAFADLGFNDACAAEKNRLSVFVSIAPQAYFVERVGGSHVEVNILLPSDQNPATYAPSPRQMAHLSLASLFFRAGMPFENVLLPKIKSNMPDLRVVETGRTIRHASTGGNHHDHGNELDPHTWMSPLLVIEHANVIRETLEQVDPYHRDEYKANYENFVRDLNLLHDEIKSALRPLAGKTFFVFHPAYGYFAETYGLKQKAVETGGKEPTARHLAGLIRRAQEEKIRVIFVQPQFSTKSAESIAQAINGTAVSLDPLAEDYINNMKQMARAVKKGLAEK